MKNKDLFERVMENCVSKIMIDDFKKFEISLVPEKELVTNDLKDNRFLINRLKRIPGFEIGKIEIIKVEILLIEQNRRDLNHWLGMIIKYEGAYYEITINLEDAFTYHYGSEPREILHYYQIYKKES